MIGTTSGRVIKLLEHGFVLWRWPNRKRVVSTQVEGSKLGLRRGDRVVVYGGPSNDGTVWLSSGAYKQRRFRSAVEIPCSLWDLEVRKLRK